MKRFTPKRKAQSDLVKERVGAAVDSVFNGSEAECEAAFMALDGLDAAEVVAELFLLVEDITEGVDLDTLIAAAEVPLPDHPREIVDAIRSRDKLALEAVTSSDDLNVVVSAIFNVIVAFKDAREQL